MTFTTISSAARRSLLGAVVALALAVAFVASASSAKAATGSPIGKLDSAGGTIGNGVVSGWAADPDVPLYSPIDVRLAVYRSQTVCFSTGRCKVGRVLVASLTQTAYDWNSEAMWALGGIAGAHGFKFSVDYAAGDTACVTALNVGLGSDTPLGCISLIWIG
ncbi:MAG: hypothetical protein E6G08_20075 [Actinobacteria bacterium]|nr:MAG: hypothetical protein E6G08_20075 [Actinomycetota bacterium]